MQMFSMSYWTTCLTLLLDCNFDATSANPVMYKIYWASLNVTNTTTKLTLSLDWRIGYYAFDEGLKDDKHYLSNELGDSIRSLHKYVWNLNPADLIITKYTSNCSKNSISLMNQVHATIMGE